MIQKIFLLFLFIISNSFLKAETIIGSGASVYDMESSEMLLSLHGKLEVSSGKMVNGKYPILFWAKCCKADMSEEGTLKRSRKLYDTLGNYIGYTRSDIYTRREVFFRNDSFYFVIIGRVDQYAIDPKSIIETELNLIFKSNRKEMIFDDFAAHFIKFNYSDGPGTGHLTSKIYLEAPVEKLNPSYRMILIFFKTELAAVVYSREINIPYYESQALSMPYKIYYMKKMSDAEKRDIAMLYLK